MPRTLKDRWHTLRWKIGYILTRPRRKVRRHRIQPHAYLETCYKDLSAGKGPGLSLYVHGREVLRFDIFGPGSGHYHMHVQEQEKVAGEPVRRLLLSGKDRVEQVEEAGSILMGDPAGYLRHSRESRIRDFRLDAAALERAFRSARVELGRSCA